MNNRVAYFDQMKGLAIILVVVGHVTQFAYGLHGTDVNRFLEIFHMPVFFYISGYFAYKTTLSIRETWHRIWKKTHAIAVPFLIWCAIWCFTHENDESLSSMLMRGGGKYWFLYTLAILSIFFILYEHVANRIKREWLYVALWLLPFFLLVSIKITGWGGVSWLAIDSLCNYYRYYLIGYLCRKYVRLNDILFNNKLIYAAAVICFFLEYYFEDRTFYPLIFLGSLGGIIIIQTYFSNSSDNGMIRCLSYLGTKTLPIYLIHYFFIPDLKQVAPILQHVGNAFVVHLTLCIILSAIIISVTLVVEKIISNNRYLNWILFGK